MINHPMAGLGDADFSSGEIEDADGGYGEADHPAYFEALGDFGTLGQGPLEDGMGRRKKRRRISIKVGGKKKKKPSFSIPTSTAQFKQMATQAVQQSLPKASIPQFTMPKISAPAIAAGLTAIPAFAAAKSLIPSFSQPKLSSPVVVSPAVDRSEIVSTGGQINQTKINQAETKAAVKSYLRPSPSHAHPLLALTNPMGEDNEMGFDLKSLWSDAKKKAQEELNKLKAKAEADLKARAGQAISNVGTSILQKPGVQAALVDQAKTQAIQNTAQQIAEAIKDPVIQKRAALGGVGVLAGLAALAYFAMKKG